MSFLSREVSEALSPAPEGALVIAPSGARAALLDAGYAVIESSVPKYDLARAFHAVIKETPEPGIHPSAVIEGPVKLGEGVIIGPGCVLQGRVEVGDGCRLGAHVCLLNDVTLGKEVRILNGALIGEDANSFGFGPGGSCFRFPSSGGVRTKGRTQQNATFQNRGPFLCRCKDSAAWIYMISDDAGGPAHSLEGK